MVSFVMAWKNIIFYIIVNTFLIMIDVKKPDWLQVNIDSDMKIEILIERKRERETE